MASIQHLAHISYIIFDILATFAKNGLDLSGKLMSSVRMSAPMAWTPEVARPRKSAARAGCGAAMVARWRLAAAAPLPVSVSVLV